MTSARLRGPLRSIVQATAIAVVLCFGLPAPLSQFVPFLAASPAVATSERDFTEGDVNAAVKKVIDERTKDGVFVFRDPKLNADLHLVFEQIKNVRGMEGYHDKDAAISRSRTTRPARPCRSNSSRSTSRCATSRKRGNISPAPTSASLAARTNIMTSTFG